MTNPLTSKARCLAAIHGEPVDHTPVFPLLMFFAQQRALPSYREYATNGHALAEAQISAFRHFGIDAVTSCSDAFRLAADLGGEMVFPENQPPHLARPLVTGPGDLARLGHPDPSAGRMADRVLGTRDIADAIGEEALVLGWVDLPFAEACSLCGVQNFMLALYEDPAFAHAVLEFLTPLVIDFALAQVTAGGAPMLGAGDAAASLISPAQYREFALPYEQRVSEALHEAGALWKLHMCGNTTNLLPDLVRCGADLFNVDHLVPFAKACEVYGGAGKCFKGNLDPVADLLTATPEQCSARARECLAQARGLRYMLSPGCEIPAATPDEVMHAFCAAVL
jgi:MtaA/CmuA family methyltransferase